MRALPALLLLLAPAALAQAPSPAAPAAAPPAAAPPAAAPAPAAPEAEAEPKPDASAEAKPDGGTDAKADEAKRPDVRTVAGKIGAVDWGEQRFTLDAADGPLPVRVDRNTLVFLESRLGTVRDLLVGLPVRAGLSGPGNLATWVEVRQRGIAPTPGKLEPAPAAPPAGDAGPPGGRREPGAPAPLPPGTPAGVPPGPGPVPGGTGSPR